MATPWRDVQRQRMRWWTFCKELGVLRGMANKLDVLHLVGHFACTCLCILVCGQVENGKNHFTKANSAACAASHCPRPSTCATHTVNSLLSLHSRNQIKHRVALNTVLSLTPCCSSLSVYTQPYTRTFFTHTPLVLLSPPPPETFRIGRVC